MNTIKFKQMFTIFKSSKIKKSLKLISTTFKNLSKSLRLNRFSPHFNIQNLHQQREGNGKV